LEIFLFGYLKEFYGSINAFIYKCNGAIKRRDDDKNYGSFYNPTLIVISDMRGAYMYMHLWLTCTF
jgi:hypothetical protein